MKNSGIDKELYFPLLFLNRWGPILLYIERIRPNLNEGRVCSIDRGLQVLMLANFNC